MEVAGIIASPSGIDLRSKDTGDAYQVMIDYRRNGALAGIYGENFKPVVLRFCCRSPDDLLARSVYRTNVAAVPRSRCNRDWVSKL
jgi:hypothetical protein